MTNKAKYEALQAELEVIERATKVYLADGSIDRENVCEGKSREDKVAIWSDYMSEELWGELYKAAIDAAAFRAEDAGLDLNKLLGRNVY